MRVETIRSTPEPEKLVCQYARGDYWDGFVPDTEYSELMEGVQVEEHHVDRTETDTMARQYALIEDLVTKGHWGPFENPQLNLYARGSSRALMAQITRHRHLTFDIQSQRYVDFGAKEDPVKTPATLRQDADTESKVNREQGLTELDERTKEYLREQGNQLVHQSTVLYDEMVEMGVPKEDARFYLPIGTKVNIGFSGNARALLHVMNMRMQADSQWEARELSGMMLDEFKQWMPWTYEVFEKHGPFRLAP